MTYRSNPFLKRMTEKTTSEQEFVRLFSPKILDRLPEQTFENGLHLLRSPPGGGKSTLLRAFTPSVLRAFWSARRATEMAESFQGLVARGVLLENDPRPQLLAISLSCASGYADLPPGISTEDESLFRALFDCRVVLRALRSLPILLGYSSSDRLDGISLEYGDAAEDFKSIPTDTSAKELLRWAEQRERSVYAQLDSIGNRSRADLPAHVRFEGVLWLKDVRFVADGNQIAPKRMLMIDDVQKLRRKQRALLIDELSVMRVQIPIWLAERSVILGEELLSQGVRQGRDVDLEELWAGTHGPRQFAAYAQNVLERRLDTQDIVPSGAFSQYLRTHLQQDEINKEIQAGIELFRKATDRYKNEPHYAEWLKVAEQFILNPSYETLVELYSTRILIARNEGKQQMSLTLDPIPAQELEERDSAQLEGAAAIFMHEELDVPYYFGIDRLCLMASSNVDELLVLSAELYEGLRANQILRRTDLALTPHEQDKRLKEVAKRKREFISRSHNEGTRARQLLDAIGTYCRRKTFQPSAPIAPGVTGVRLSQPQLAKLFSKDGPMAMKAGTLRKVLAECVGENLLLARQSAATTGRDSGTVFYLNRTLCAYYNLPLPLGGWQDVAVDELIDWMENTTPDRRKPLKVE